MAESGKGTLKSIPEVTSKYILNIHNVHLNRLRACTLAHRLLRGAIDAVCTPTMLAV